METTESLELRDANIYPDNEVLSSVLGKSFEVYLKLLDLFKKNELEYEWRYYKDGKAWLCKVQKKNKTIVWISAWKGYLEATIYFPLRLLNNIIELDISDDQKKRILKTKNVGKSKPCTFEIHEANILIDFEKVMQLKIKCK